MKYLIAISTLILLTACEADPAPVQAQAIRTTGTSTIIVGTYEDCTIYRTSIHYYSDVSWVRCEKKPKEIITSVQENCGKGCRREVITHTLDELK